jgi:hypothetical protein
MSQLFTSLLAGGVSGTIVAFLLKTWIEVRLKASVEHEYDKKLEAFRLEIRVREQAAKVAELFSEANEVDGPLTPDRVKQLNRLSWELSLWLPADTVRDLTSHLCRAPGSKHMKDILISARKHILMNPDDDLRAEQIVHFAINSATTTPPVAG